MKETLEAYRLSGEDINIIMELIIGNFTRFNTAYGFSEKVQTTAGVRQGDSISPALYILFLNLLLEWLERTKKGYSISKDNTIDKAFADDMALVSGSKKGIELMMERVNRFMEYNNVIINETKSHYHWNNSKKGPADLRTRGHKLNQRGEGGLFTYLGWIKIYSYHKIHLRGVRNYNRSESTSNKYNSINIHFL